MTRRLSLASHATHLAYNLTTTGHVPFSLPSDPSSECSVTVYGCPYAGSSSFVFCRLPNAAVSWGALLIFICEETHTERCGFATQLLLYLC